MSDCIQSNETPIGDQQINTSASMKWYIEIKQIQEKTKTEFENLLKFVCSQSQKSKSKMDQKCQVLKNYKKH
jgi:hypothetical protein